MTQGHWHPCTPAMFHRVWGPWSPCWFPCCEVEPLWLGNPSHLSPPRSGGHWHGGGGGRFDSRTGTALRCMSLLAR